MVVKERESKQESRQVKKVREKLEKVLQEEHSHFNKEELNEVKHTIYQWIARHEPERVSIKNKSFTLFDENQHSSPLQSHYVQSLMEDIKEGFAKKAGKTKLAGRVKNPKQS